MSSKIFFVATVAVFMLFLAACAGATNSGPGVASVSQTTGIGNTNQDTNVSPADISADTTYPGSTGTDAVAVDSDKPQSLTTEPITAATTNTGATAVAGGTETPTTAAPSSRASSEPTSTATPTPPPPTLLAQALASPGLMWCLTGNIGLEAVIDLSDRSPSSSERFAVSSCLSDTQEIAAWNVEWPKRIDAAFPATTCGTAPTNNFPANYYQGPLIDTHLHIPQLPDDTIGDAPDENYEAPRGAESDLYDNIDESQRPLLGRTMDIGKIACTLQNEGSIKAFAFFSVFPEITSPAIQVARRAVEEYPNLFVPFIQASANGSATLEGKLLDVMLEVDPELFAGFGEVGDSPTESINPLPDSDVYTGDFQVVQDRGNTLVYFHPGMGHQDNLERALQQFSDVTFIIHADFVRPHVQGIMDRNPNVYYTYNDIFGISGEVMETFRFGDKENFIADIRSEWDQLLDEAVELYRPMIEAHPDRFMWGTDRGDIVWGYDEEVGQVLAEFGRAFIGRFDPAIQADLGYKNAERLIALTTKP